MTSKVFSNLRSEGGFFRSSVAVALSGMLAGGSVIATAAETHSLDLKAAIATIVSAAVVALADWLVRRKRMAEHEANVEREHEKTRALIRSRHRRKTLSFLGAKK